MHSVRGIARLGVACVLLSWPASVCLAQELDPRRWGHLPIGTNFAAAGYAYTEADFALDPVLRIEDVKMELHTWAAAYIRTFELFGRTARVDVVQAWLDGRWTGLLDGVPTTVRRQGWSDSFVRFAVNLIGAPPLAGKEYVAYRAGKDVETIVGVALGIQLPTGEYKKDKLINLGTNRFTFRPQIGVTHRRGKWTFEAGGAVWIHTDNNSFFNGNKWERDPLYTFQSHVLYTFRPGLWAAASAGYNFGRRSTLNGVEANDHRQHVTWALSAGYPITRWLGVKAAYLGRRHQSAIGYDSDTFTIALSTFW